MDQCEGDGVGTEDKGTVRWEEPRETGIGANKSSA